MVKTDWYWNEEEGRPFTEEELAEKARNKSKKKPILSSNKFGKMMAKAWRMSKRHETRRSIRQSN